MATKKVLPCPSAPDRSAMFNNSDAISVIMDKRTFSAAGNKTKSAECVALCRREEKKGVIL